MQNKTLYIIFLSFITCQSNKNVFSQSTTTNLILNNSFESFNKTSPSYFPHFSAIEDSSYAETPVNCWVSPSQDWYPTTVIDLITAVRPDVQLYIYPKHLQQELMLESYFHTFDSSYNYYIGSTRGHLATVQTKLRTPLQSGVQYRLTGYLNSAPYVGENDYINDGINGWWGFWQCPARIGFYFTPNQVFDSQVTWGNLDSSWFFMNTPTVTYSVLPFENDFGNNNAWQYFELTFTATANDSFLSIAQPDTGTQRYPKVDSLLNLCSHDTVDCSFAYYGTRRALYLLDNLTLIPLSDTGKTVVNLHIPDPDSLFLETNILACNVASISLQSGADFWSYQWSTGDTTADVQVSADGTYYVTVSNGCGLYSDSVTVRFAATDTIPLLLSADKTDLCNDTALLTASSGFDFY